MMMKTVVGGATSAEMAVGAAVAQRGVSCTVSAS